MEIIRNEIRWRIILEMAEHFEGQKHDDNREDHAETSVKELPR